MYAGPGLWSSLCANVDDLDGVYYFENFWRGLECDAWNQLAEANQFDRRDVLNEVIETNANEILEKAANI